MWPWRVASVLMVGAVTLYLFSVAGIVTIKVFGIRELIMLALNAGAFVYEYVIDSRWKRDWKLSEGSEVPHAGAVSDRGRLFYIFGMCQMYAVEAGLIAAVYWTLFSLESLSALLFGWAVAHGLLKSARQLTPIPDTDQTDAKKMAEFGLEPLATEAEMTRTGIIAIGAGVLLTLVLCLRLLYLSLHK